MIKINEANTIDYLSQTEVFLGVDWEKVKVKEIKENTNVNYVFEVQLNLKLKVFLKQAFDYVKVAPNHPAPIDRQYFEKLSIEYLYKIWGNKIPKIVYYDKKNNILIVSDMGQGAKLLADEIKNGKLHLNVGKDLGDMMARLHSLTYGLNDYPARDMEANKKHVAFIIDFRLRGCREVFPDKARELVEKSRSKKTSIIYGDWAPKNIFVANNRIRLVDFENVCRFDPAFDIGYALAHWLLELTGSNLRNMVKFVQEFEKGYLNRWPRDKKSQVMEIFRRATKYTGAMMLHRFAGEKNTNRVEVYATKAESLIKISNVLLSGKNSRLSEEMENLRPVLIPDRFDNGGDERFGT